MGSNDAPQMADGFGVPTFYITDVVKEDAGGGNARIWNCQRRGGILIPQCEIIIHSSRLLPIGADVSGWARELHRRQQMAEIVAAVGCH